MNYDPGNEYRRTDVDVSMYQNNNVEPGTKYEFRVSARNQEYTGKQSILQVFTKPLDGKTWLIWCETNWHNLTF